MDRRQIVDERIASQYRESTRLKGYIRALASEVEHLDKAARDVVLLRSIDSATGAQLDILGVLVGQTRTVVDASTLSYFGFAGAPNAVGFGEARYASRREITDAVRLLEDPEYRLFIRARIVKNSSRGVAEEVIQMTKFLLGGDPLIVVNDLGSARLQVGLGAVPDINKRLLLIESGLFPKPAGVQVEFLLFNEPPFGFNGVATAAGFNSGWYATAV